MTYEKYVTFFKLIFKYFIGSKAIILGIELSVSDGVYYVE
jgi:hypothetical protein